MEQKIQIRSLLNFSKINHEILRASKNSNLFSNRNKKMKL